MLVRRAICGMFVMLLAGCASSPRGYTAPPTSVRPSSIAQARSAPTAVLIIGEFENPQRASLNWRDIGPGISEALSRALLDRGRYDVIIKPALSRELQRLVANEAPERDPILAKVRAAHPDVDYVIVGTVTDFQHTTDLPVEIRPKTWLGNPKSEAIVAIDLVVVDVRNERLVAADHVTGEAPAGNEPSRTLYQNVAFGSYVFWNTPLGKASRSAIERTVGRIDALIPGVPAMPTYAGRPFGSARVAQLISRRGVAITGGRNCGLLPEQVYALAPSGSAIGDESSFLRDPVTGKLVLLKIDECRATEATGWLLGECGDVRQLIRAELRPVPAQPALAVATFEPVGADILDDSTLGGAGASDFAVTHAERQNAPD